MGQIPLWKLLSSREVSSRSVINGDSRFSQNFKYRGIFRIKASGCKPCLKRKIRSDFFINIETTFARDRATYFGHDEPFIIKRKSQFLNFIKVYILLKEELRILLNDWLFCWEMMDLERYFLKYRLINKWNFFRSLLKQTWKV